MEERKIKRIDYSGKFLKSLEKLPKRIIEQAELKEKIVEEHSFFSTLRYARVFKENAFDPRLKTHKLSGQEKECWAFWVNYFYRIKFIFLNDEEVLFLGIGTHEIYK